VQSLRTESEMKRPERTPFSSAVEALTAETRAEKPRVDYPSWYPPMGKPDWDLASVQSEFDRQLALLGRLDSDERMNRIWAIAAKHPEKARMLVEGVMHAWVLSQAAGAMPETESDFIAYIDRARGSADELHEFFSSGWGKSLSSTVSFEDPFQILRSLEAAKVILNRSTAVMTSIFQSMPPLTRKRNVESVHRVTFMVVMSGEMKRLFGQWHDEEVASLTDVVFDTTEATGVEAVRSARRRSAKRSVSR
jgi:hypothetical protein